MLQLSELDELSLEAYESYKICKERTKRWHDKYIINKWFREGEMGLLFTSKLRLFAGKLRSRQLGPFRATKVFPHEAVEVWSESTNMLKVNA